MTSAGETEKSMGVMESEQCLKRNKEAKRSASDTLQSALGEGIGDQLSLADPSGVTVAEKLYCQLCGTWLGLKGAILKDHCLGKNVKQPDGTFSLKPGGHARKVASLPPTKTIAPPPSPSQPTIVVNVTSPVSSNETPPAKKQKAAGSEQSTLLSMVQKGNAAETFHKDTKAFATTNIPLEKLATMRCSFFWASISPRSRPSWSWCHPFPSRPCLSIRSKQCNGFRRH